MALGSSLLVPNRRRQSTARPFLSYSPQWIPLTAIQEVYLETTTKIILLTNIWTTNRRPDTLFGKASAQAQGSSSEEGDASRRRPRGSL